MLRSDSVNSERNEILIYIQDQLMISAAALARDNQNPDARIFNPDPECVYVLEREIDKMEEQLIPLDSFLLPGGNAAVSLCHVSRCVCRRAERTVLRLSEEEETPELVRKFLNRLSDYLFVLSRIVGKESGNKEIKWTFK